MPPLEMAGFTIFILLLLVGIYAVIIGLPGTLLILATVFIYILLGGFQKIGLTTSLLLVFLSIIAEAIGFATDMRSKLRLGLSSRCIAASLVGAALGALCLTPLLFGLGTLVGLFLGAFCGLMIMELISQVRLKPKHRAPSGAICTTAVGIFAKGTCALTMTILSLSKIYS